MQIEQKVNDRQAINQTPVYLAVFNPTVLWAAACFGSILGFSRLAFGLFLPSMRDDIGGNYSAYGLAQTSNFAGYLIGTLAVPAILARYSNRPKLALIGLIVMNLSLGLHATAFDLWQLAFWRFIVGLTSAVATVLVLTLAVELVQAEKRGQASGLVWSGGAIGNGIAGLIAPLVISIGSGYAWRLAWVVLGVAGLVATIGFFLYIRKYHSAPVTTAGQANHSQVKFKEILAILLSPNRLLFVTIAYFCFGFGYIIGITYFISLLVSQGMPNIYTGFVWAFGGVLGIFSGTFWGRMTDRYPAGLIMTVTMFLSSAGTFIMVTNIIWLEIIGNAFSFFCLIGPPLLVTVVLRRELSGEQYTASFSLLTAIFAVGQILGPVVGGVVSDNLGLSAGIVVGAVVLGLGGFCGLIYSLQNAKKVKQRS
jgi:predicted MFS family arabinose efflux permease